MGLMGRNGRDPGKQDMRHDILVFCFLDCGACIAYPARVTALAVFKSVILCIAVYVSCQGYVLVNLLCLVVDAFHRMTSFILPVYCTLSSVLSSNLGGIPGILTQGGSLISQWESETPTIFPYGIDAFDLITYWNHNRRYYWSSLDRIYLYPDLFVFRHISMYLMSIRI